MSLKTFLTLLGGVMLAALVAGIVVLALTYRRLKRLRIPADADLFTTLRAVPLALVVGLDLLDLGLDVLSAPLSWFLLNRLGLQSLRNVAAFEALLPFTGPIPVLTLAWFAARFLGLGRPIDPNLIPTRRVGPGRYEGDPL